MVIEYISFNAFQANIESQLQALGMSKSFDATIISVHKDSIIISTRYDSAVTNVAESPKVSE